MKPDFNIEEPEADQTHHVDARTGNPIDFGNTNFNEIFHTVVIKNNSEHIHNFKEAVREEIEGLMEKGVFKEVKNSSFYQ